MNEEEKSVISFPENPEEHLKESDKDMIMAEKKRRISSLPRFREEVLSRNAIRHRKNVKEGDIFWVTMDQKAYIVSRKEGARITIAALDENAAISTGLSIYDFSESVAKRMLPIDDNKEYMEKLSQGLQDWFENQEIPCKYFLMYGRKIHYFTLFKINNHPEDFAQEIVDSALSVGRVVSMDIDDEKNAVEIWVRTAEDKVEQMFLFPYDKGIVEV